MSDVFSTPDDLGEIRSSDVQTGLGESLSAQASSAFTGGFNTIGRSAEYLAAEHGWTSMLSGFGSQQPWLHPDAPDVSIDDAKAQVKQQGLDGYMKLPDQDTIRAPVLNLMMQDAREKAQYSAAVDRGPSGFLPGALGFMTQVGAGMADPVNAAAFAIPVIGEARYGKILASAGESLLGRTAIRAGVGVAQGAVGGAALLPADWWLHTQDGQDYTMADALKSVVMSAGMGGAFHAAGGGLGDLYARARGRPLAGTLEDLQQRAIAGDTHAAEIVEQLGNAGTHLPEAALSDEGVATDQVPGVTPPPEASPVHPADVISDLPQRAQEDLVHATTADLINGEPARAGELLKEAAKEDPRIAETVDAWHGSPHDFDQFDMSKLGTGEGAQAYGHGLYLAENEDVAGQYRKTTTYKSFIRKVQELYGEHDSPSDAETALEESKDFTPQERELLHALHDDDWLGFDYPHQAVSAIVHEPEAFSDTSDRTKEALRNFGNVYKVKVHANPEHFLDWDKPVNEQSEHVRQALAPMLERERDLISSSRVSGLEKNDLHASIESGSIKASDLYNRQVSREAASAELRKAGVPGIKYLDQGSRPGVAPKYRVYREGDRFYVAGKKPAEGGPFDSEADAEKWIRDRATRNYVVFDDKLIRITHKNGKEVGLDEAKAAARSPAAAAAEGGTSPTIGEPEKALAAKAKGPKGKDPSNYSLVEFLASQGGIRSDDPLIEDLRGSVGKNKNVPGFGNLIKSPKDLSTAARRGGVKAPMTLDRAREAAIEAGYMRDHGDETGGGGKSTIGDLLELVDKESRGEPVYREGVAAPERPVDPAEVAHQREQLEQHVDDLMKEWGVTSLQKFIKRRALGYLDNGEEFDAETALERAVSDFEKAPADQAAGAGADKADWQKLAARRSGDDDLADASREADKTEPPTSAEMPAKSVTAAEAAAGEADKLLADILPKLSDDERKTFEDKLTELADDRTAREQIVRDGAACLAAAGLEEAA